LSKLLDEVAGEPVQVEVSAVRILFELLGFLLKTSCQLSAVSYTKYTPGSRFVLLSETTSTVWGWCLTALLRSVYNEGRTF
jgi:hypothetical protein